MRPTRVAFLYTSRLNPVPHGKGGTVDWYREVEACVSWGTQNSDWLIENLIGRCIYEIS